MGMRGVSRSRFPVAAGVVLIMVAFLHTAGCTSPTFGPDTPYQPPEIVVQYSRTGGIAAFDDKLVIFDNGQAVYSRRQVAGEFTLSPDELRELEALLIAADFPSLDPSYEAPAPGADYFQYTITYEGIAIATETEGIPDVLVPVLARLDELLGVHAPLS
jgi:hypothetical protein